MRKNGNIPNGFTLLELMVVISLIMLLLSILAPTVGKVFNHARDTQCKALLHSIGSGVGQFSGDNGGRLPDPNRMDANYYTTPNRTSYADLVKYQSAPWFDPRCGHKDASQYGIPVSPSVFNRTAGTVTEAGGVISPVYLNQIRSASTTAGVACYAPFKNPMTFGAYNESGDPLPADKHPEMKPDTADQAPWPMHGDRDQVNIYLLDGQVKAFFWTDVSYNGGQAPRQYLWSGYVPGETGDTSTVLP